MGGLDLGAAAIVIQNGFGIPQGDCGTQRRSDRFGTGLPPRELPLPFVHPFGRALVAAFIREYIDLALDEGPPPKEPLDPIDDEPSELSRCVRSGIGKTREPLWSVVGPDPMRPPCHRSPKPFRRGVYLRPVLPNQVVRPAGMGTVRTTVVRHVHHVGEHLAGDCDQKVVSAEDRDRELRRFFPTVCADSSKTPGEESAPRRVVRAKVQRPACGLSSIPEPVELEEKRGMKPEREAVRRMASQKSRVTMSARTEWPAAKWARARVRREWTSPCRAWSCSAVKTASRSS